MRHADERDERRKREQGAGWKPAPGAATTTCPFCHKAAQVTQRTSTELVVYCGRCQWVGGVPIESSIR
jgi:transcription elongation factor Elf1